MTQFFLIFPKDKKEKKKLYEVGIIMYILKTRKLKLREAKWLTQRCRTWEQGASADVGPGVSRRVMLSPNKLPLSLFILE